MPRPATNASTSGQSAMISAAVVSSWARGLAGLPYWYGITKRGSAAASCLASATAPLEPSSPGESMISAPNSSSSWRRSRVTLAGITTATR